MFGPGLLALLVAVGGDGDELFFPGAREPTEIELALRSYGEKLRELPPLAGPPGEPPSFVTPELLLRAIPPAKRGDTSEPRLEDISGELVDPDRGLYVLWYPWGAIEGSLALVSGKGGLLDVVVLHRANVRLLDVAGDKRPEILVQTIDGMSVSVYPSRWRLFAIGRGDRLREIARVAGHYAYGSKTPIYCFFNELAFPAPNRMVTRALAVDPTCISSQPWPSGSPRRTGEVHRYRYDPHRQRFVAE